MTDGMSADADPRQLHQQLERARLVDQICRQFENAWNAGQQPRVEECLVDLDETIRHEVLTELLAVEFELRRASGETPRHDEYLRRFPESADTVSALIGEPLSTDAAPPDNARLPERLGEFRIVREIGRGGMGVVYEAVQESLQRKVALKSLLHRIESHGDSRRRFEREARAIARLHHSHIVDVFGNGEHDGIPFFAMRFIDGEGLNKIITDCREVSDAPRQGPAAVTGDSTQRDAESLPNTDIVPTILTGPATSIDEAASAPARNVLDAPREVSTPRESSNSRETSITEPPAADRSTSRSIGINNADIDGGDIDSANTVSKNFRLPQKLGDRERTVALIGRQIASALHYAHESGIVHRDIKPSNILIDAEGDPWVTDFGLARLSGTELEASLTMEGSILGTLRYLPPESLQQTTDERGDQYSLGLTLYEMLALRPAFDRTDKAGLLHDLEHAARPALDDLQPDVSRDLVTIIHKAIDREPSARYANSGELADDLQRFLDDEPITARRISRLEQLSRWRRRNRGLAASLATVAALLLVVAAGSAIAAGYFSSLNTKLSLTVGELTTTTAELTTKTNDLTLKTGELTVARNKAEDTVYFSRIALADRAWQTNDVQAARDLLNKCQPQPGEIDRRGWESRYLDGLCHSEVVHVEQPNARSFPYLYGVAFSPDGRWLATGSSSPWDTNTAKSVLAIWDTRDYSVVGSLGVDINNPRRLIFSADSRAIALLGEAGTVLLAFDRKTTDSIPLDQIKPDAFAAPEPIVAEFDKDASGTVPVLLRDRPTGEVVRTLPHPGSTQEVSVSSDGRLAATAGDDSALRIWDVRSGEITHILRGHPTSLYSVAFSPDNHQVASTARDGIRIWDLTRAQQQLTLPVPHTIFQGERLADFAFSEDGDKLIAAEQTDDGVRIGVARVVTGERLHFSHRNDLTFRPGQFSVFTVSPSARKFVAPLHRNPYRAVVCDLDSGRVLDTLSDPAGPILSVTFSRDGRLIATTGDSRSPVRLWNGRTGQLMRTLAANTKSAIHEPPRFTPPLAFSPSGDQLACCYAPEIGMHIWDTNSGQLVCQLPGPDHRIPASGSFSANGRQFAVCFRGDSNVLIFDLLEKRQQFRLTAADSTECVEFSPTESRLAAAGQTGHAYVWDSVTGELILRLNPSMAGRRDYAFGPRIHWSPDGRRLATNNWLGKIDVWDAPASLEPLARRLAVAETRSTLWFIQQSLKALEADDEAESRRHAEKVRHKVDLSPAAQIARGFMWARLREWKLAAADLYPSVAHPSNFRRLVSQHSDQSDELIHEAGKISPNVPELQIALANLAKQAGDQEAANQHRTRALSLLEHELAERPDDSFAARHLADLIRLSNKDAWHGVKIQSAESASEATLTLQDDGSILASGNDVAGDVYTVTAQSDVERVAAIRLDVLPDPSLPNQGPGRHPDSGNFQLAEIRLLNSSSTETSTDESHAFKDAWASFQFQANDVNVLGTIRQDDPRVWHVWSQFGQPHHAIFVLKEPVSIKPGQPLVIDLRHHNGGELNIGRFRISVGTNPFVVRDLKERQLFNTEHLPPFLALAAARLAAQENDKALAALKQSPESDHPTESAIRLLLLARAHARLDHNEQARDTRNELLEHLKANPLPSPFDSLNTESIRTGLQSP